MIKIGDKDVKKIYVGDKPVKKVMLGDKQIWPAEQLTAPADDPIWFAQQLWMQNTEGVNYGEYQPRPCWMTKSGTDVTVKYERVKIASDGEHYLFGVFQWNVNARKANPMTSYKYYADTGYNYNGDLLQLYYSNTLQLWVLNYWGRNTRKECFPICFTEEQCKGIEPFLSNNPPE